MRIKQKGTFQIYVLWITINQKSQTPDFKTCVNLEKYDKTLDYHTDHLKTDCISLHEEHKL